MRTHHRSFLTDITDRDSAIATATRARQLGLDVSIEQSGKGWRAVAWTEKEIKQEEKRGA